LAARPRCTTSRRPSRDAEHLVLRRGRYYARRRVPADLVDLLGASDLTKALATGSRREAQRLAHLWGERLQAGFVALRSAILPTMASTTPRDWLNNFASEAFGELAREELQAQVNRALEGSLSTGDAEEVAEVYDTMFSELVEAVHEGEEWALRAALNEVGQVPETLPREHWQVAAVAVLRAIKSLRFDVHRLPVNPRRAPSIGPVAPAGADMQALHDQLAATMREEIRQSTRARHAKNLGDAIKAYERVMLETKAAREATVRASVAQLRRFSATVGTERDLDDIRSEEVSTYIASLTDDNGNPLATGTRRLYASKLIAFYSAAIKHEWATRNPAHGLRPKSDTASNASRDPFTPDQLRKIFGPELIKGASERVSHGERRGAVQSERLWIPLAMLTMGARPNEVAQLLVSEVVEVDGLLCLSIDPDDETGERRTKNESSRRTVPVPQTMLDLGFGEYVAQRRTDVGDDSSAQLFPALFYAKSHGYAAKLTMWFGGKEGFLSQVGVKDDRLTLYSLKRNFVDRAFNAGVSDVVRTDIAGHSRSGDQGIVTYLSKRTVAEMKTGVDAIDWSDVLGELRVLLGR
jgi:hypothetical protein